MSDKRTDFKQHVRAAKEWLGEAESSLDKEEDLRGDLNLMLAQAELQRAHETKHLTARQRLIKRVVPVVCAMFVLGVVWQVFTVIYPKPIAEPVHERPAETQAVKELPAKKIMPLEKQEITLHEREIDVPAAAESPAVEESSPAVEESSPAEANEPVKEPAAAVPDRDMQKLMNTAGKSLRAQ